ncbi:Uncharacterized protein HZ326_28307 [Fusarium oxysporum f. sp. albedinis]|nr:Uncharacterized protein HZ326_28307 [Fusarium oxysporum f. sp. albedinis]
MARPKLETSMLHRRIIIPVIPHPEFTALKIRAQAAGNRSLRNSSISASLSCHVNYPVLSYRPRYYIKRRPIQTKF